MDTIQNSTQAKAHAASGDPTTRLSTLRRGESAVVVEVDDQQPRLLARLAARGLVSGTALQLLRAGDPLLILVEGSRWALSRADADHIQIRPMPRSIGRRLLGLLLP